MTQDMFGENWNGQSSVRNRRSQTEIEFFVYIQGLGPSNQIDAVPIGTTSSCSPLLSRIRV